jgi:hypothetical protein
MELYMATADDTLSDEPFEISIDGLRRRCTPGERIELHPGESVCLPPRLYHAFWAAGGEGTVLAGEVSDVNDDERDNRFLKPAGRFPEIEEDQAPLFLLCTEYPGAR